MPQTEKSVLHVEGTDDGHVIAHLLSRHGVDIDTSGVEIKVAQGKDALLPAMDTAVRLSTGRSVGFVLDADEVPEDRWRAARGRLEGTGVNLPKDIPQAGFMGETELYQAQVGVWLMPDNSQAGALEHFLQGLVADGDALFAHAKTSTALAKDKGAAFSEGKRLKSELHAWLAWQEEPGLRYGSALKAHYFGHDSDAALAFVNWFGQVFLTP